MNLKKQYICIDFTNPVNRIINYKYTYTFNMKALKLAVVALGVSLFAVPTQMVSAHAATVMTISQESKNKKNNTEVQWDSEVIEVGDIPQGVPYTFKFEFKNKTKTPVEIVKVQAQCGCTAADYSKDPIKKKKKGYVNATFNAAAPGPFSKTVTVTTSDTNKPKVLTFKGNVVAK